MDYDWLLRIHNKEERGIYTSDIKVYMDNKGLSKESFINTMNEERLISICHGLNPIFRMDNYYGILRGLKLPSLDRWCPCYD